MLRIAEYDTSDNYRTLTHSADVFHKALRSVLNGEKRFHVTGAAGKYDLVYETNNDFYFVGNNLQNTSIFAGETLLPPYFIYDEYDDSKLHLAIVKRYENVVFEQANEYTIALARIFIRFTDKEIYFLDEKAGWFFEDGGRFHLGTEPTDGKSELRVIEYKTRPDFQAKDIKLISIFLFHEIFMMQWISGDIPIGDIKYVEFCVKKTEGIGALLQFSVKCEEFFGEFGIKPVFKLGSSRYSDEMLSKYFRIETTPDDSDESNTIYLINYLSLMRSYAFMMSRARVSLDVLNPDFLSEMNEYSDAVLGGKHVLGVLYRSTDYKAMLGDLKNIPLAPVSVETMIPVIQDRIDKYHYDGIFVATEDGEALKKLRDAFPGKVFAVSQERYKQDDFKPGSTISELEKEIYSQDEYEGMVTDTTINYFYALYMLSKCDGFLASSFCSGVGTVRSFNEGRFECDDIVREMILKGLIEEIE